MQKNLIVTVIEPGRRGKLLDWKEMRQFKDLLYFLVWRDIKVLYKQTILGFSWAIIRPLFGMLIFSVVFGRLAKVPSDGIPYPIFSYAGLIPWSYFSSAFTGASQSLVTQTNVITKIYFPRLFIPLTPVLARLVDFAISFIVVCLLMIYYGFAPTWNIVFLPYLTLLLVLTASGIGFFLSALALQYRDVKHGMEFLSQLLMYAAPVVWPASLVPQQFRLLYGLYPMVGAIEGFRSSLIGKSPMPWDLILMSTIGACLICFCGAVFFASRERMFADIA